ncbi:MAG: DUF2946 domain-containing protein [Variovorax sp.]|nr:MAG: DUF2946 domain-containing protein [Variovorax sp.]
MRILILALAILLLPLRGWLGDAMAIDAMHTPAAAVQAMADGGRAMHDMAGMSHDAHAAHDVHGAQQADPDCQSTCGDCQLCHSVAMTVWPELADALEAPRAAPAFSTTAFASAEPAPGFKPPIS